MRIFVRPSADFSQEAIDLAHRRLEFALGRFAGRVRTLTVRLKDLNGPRGGPDKHCQIAVRLERPRRVIVIEDVDTEPEAAISRAAERASRAVARAIQAAGDRRQMHGAAPSWS
ncbi:MAG: HPF/RaiA family ribosome-associated protein [Acidobacteria bacterium]|nr:HPF/RaiA family ribosome-associated protein [Acidobacteriota bacterium]